jgi:hypothetical protein
MTLEDQILAIAEFDGWRIKTSKNKISRWFKLSTRGKNAPWNTDIDVLPNYTTDLNALHLVENKLDFVQRLEWTSILRDIVHRDNTYYMSATALQRCEAILKTIGKWS